MTEAMIGYGTRFRVADAVDSSPLNYVDMGEIYNVTPPSPEVDQIEATHSQSPDRRKEYIDGLIDQADCSFQMNYIPGSDSDDLLNEILDTPAGENRSRLCQIIYPNNVLHTFLANLSKYQPDIPTGDRMTATVTFKVTGAITRGVFTP